MPTRESFTPWKANALCVVVLLLKQNLEVSFVSLSVKIAGIGKHVFNIATAYVTSPLNLTTSK
jgi:hypothetical protein